MKVWIGVISLRMGCINGALVNIEMKLQVPQKVGNFLTKWAAVTFSRKTLLPGVGWLLKNIRFHKRQGIYWQDEQLSASQAELCYMELVG